MGYNNTRHSEWHPGVAQFGSALEWGSRGREFDSRHSDQKPLIERSMAFLLWRAKEKPSPRGKAKNRGVPCVNAQMRPFEPYEVHSTNTRSSAYQSTPISISYTFHSTNWKKICPVTLEKELEKQRTNSKKTDLTVLPRTEKTANSGLKNTKQASWFCPQNAKKQLCEKDFIRKRRKVTDERTLKIEHKCDKMRHEKI